MSPRSLSHLAPWAVGILAVMLVSAMAGTRLTVSADTPTPTPTPTATPIPTNTPGPNSAPTLEVLQLSRIEISTRHQSSRAFRLYLGGPASRGAEIPVGLRGRDADGNRLTRTELEVISRFIKGQSSEAIAEERGLSERNISNQLGTGCHKLGFGDRRELRGWGTAVSRFVLAQPDESQINKPE
jgi:DNA-binding CsgD family transcriptional regulator